MTLLMITLSLPAVPNGAETGPFHRMTGVIALSKLASMKLLERTQLLPFWETYSNPPHKFVPPLIVKLMIWIYGFSQENDPTVATFCPLMMMGEPDDPALSAVL